MGGVFALAIVLSGVPTALANGDEAASGSRQVELSGMQVREMFRERFELQRESTTDISKEVERNQKNIAKLTELLNSADISAEVKAIMETQLTAMQTQQTRLQDVAAGQAKLWGLFSWRF